MVFYETMFRGWNGKMQEYRTKKLTLHHAYIRESEAKKGFHSRTLQYDTSVDWPFGCYAEVIGDNEVKEQRKKK